MDINAIRDRLKKLQSTSAKSNLTWKPTEGENLIRIVPYQFDKENPFIELYFHYNISKRSMLSLATFDEPDPICEFTEKLATTGVKEDWVLSKKIEPKLRTHVPIIVRGKEEEGVKFWAFGKEVYTELLGFIADPDYGDITDLNTGRDVTVTYTKGVEGKTFPTTGIRVKPNASKATTSKKVYELITTGQTDIFDIFTKPTYDELKSALQKWLTPEDEGEVETPKAPAKPATKAPVASKPDLSDDLMDDDDEIKDDLKEDTILDAPSVDDFDDLFDDDTK